MVEAIGVLTGLWMIATAIYLVIVVGGSHVWRERDRKRDF